MSLVSVVHFIFGFQSASVTSKGRPDTLLDPLLHEESAGLTFRTDPESGLSTTLRLSSTANDSQEEERIHEKTEEPLLVFTPPSWNPRIISDAIIGLSDGLTVPFALSAGLSALGNTKVVIFGGLAELIAGAISMGLGGYLAARSEAEFYRATLSKTRLLALKSPCEATSLVRFHFAPYRLEPTALDSIVLSLAKSPHLLIDFLMRFHHELPKPAYHRAYVSAITIAAGYFLGGILPLLPYFFVEIDEVERAFWWSVAVMVLALFVFGYGKTCLMGGWKGTSNLIKGMRGAIQMVGVGGAAAGAAMFLVKAFS
ncbi:hypothetical protein MMC17_002949 [Xylographa soralifera]|nr:hypothetical protein [Xylographa soralifera]